MFLKKQKGLTLIEVIVVLGIFIFVLGAISSFTIYNYRAKNFAFSRALSIDNARKTIDKIGKEMKEAIQADSGAYLLEKAENFEIIFYSDIDHDNNVEKVRYFLNEEKLKKGVIQASGSPANYTGPETIKTVASYVKNTSTPIFYYFSESYAGQATGTPMSTPVSPDKLDEVTLIGIKTKIDTNPFRAPDILTIRSKSQIRNAKQEY